MKLKNRAEPELDVDMTPMIDCVFLLLIFFMVVATMSKVDLTPEIELPVAPKAAIAEDLRARGIINILPVGTVTAAGETVTVQKPFMVSGALTDDAGLRTSVINRRAAEPELRVVMRIDQSTEFEIVQRAIKACADAGIFDIIFSSYQSSGSL
ncbi:MAG TPA: biopolymer transporter ExbD [Kiritimatiellia bacterium]|nr:biopolymer transporter ExbD [Kiritimatiellia bacterium]HMO99456.1 biopolymer transporter ExbD [Kiritimatiellia bacterium]HMP97256.1 biopolymer transporter ExbD [Kiritimatiellia bacterium]